MGARQPLKIAYLTSNDPRDRRSWSGTHYYLAQALQKHCGDVTFLGPIQSASLTLAKITSRALKLSTGRTFLYTHTLPLSNRIARIAEQKISQGHYDLIFAPAGSTEIAHLSTALPVVYSSDATVRLVHGYHPEFSQLFKRSLRQANLIEQLAIERADMILYPSLWAAESAVRDYHADKRKVHVVPFGANIDEYPPLGAIMNRPSSKGCRLLFVGVDWQYKGGKIAFETLLALRQRGIPAEMTVVGCVPPKNLTHSNLRVFPFLNKNNLEDEARLRQLYMDSDFFLLPSRVECYGIAFCEANAFGLPVIARDTGGVPGVVKNGENGFLLPPTAQASDYAELILSLHSDQQRYQELRVKSRAAFEDRLNWDAWGKSVHTLLEELVSHGSLRRN